MRLKYDTGFTRSFSLSLPPSLTYEHPLSPSSLTHSFESSVKSGNSKTQISRKPQKIFSELSSSKFLNIPCASENHFPRFPSFRPGPWTMAFCKNLKISIGSMKSPSTDPSILLINAAGFTLNSCGDSLCPWLVL